VCGDATEALRRCDVLASNVIEYVEVGVGSRKVSVRLAGATFLVGDQQIALPRSQKASVLLQN
jgi:hypothetical protein